MSVKIRLSRHGAKKKPFYRIVVSDARSPRDGKFIDQVGSYDPKSVSGGVKIDREKMAKWLKRGARPSQTVAELIKKTGTVSS
ncbi:MAG: 30S ribosomal protein S16 [Candidatus Binatota bacterium]